MTRKNVSDGILGTLCKVCPLCGGTGYIKSEETVRLEIERKIRNLARESNSKAFLIKLNPTIASLVIGKGGKNLANLESITKKYIAIKGDEDLPLDAFEILSEGQAKDIKEADRKGQDLGLDFREYAFYSALEVNDSAVKILGDDVLRLVFSQMARGVRNTDFLARYGGDELTLIMNQTNLESALLVAEKITRKLENFFFKAPASYLTIWDGKSLK